MTIKTRHGNTYVYFMGFALEASELSELAEELGYRLVKIDKEGEK